MEGIVVKQEEITAYIQSIPPSPTVLKNVLKCINDGELSKAALAADEDPALKLYLQNIVNKPIYGFKNAIKETSQIFGVLGLTQAEQIVYNYMISLLTPKKWELFSLNDRAFSEMQDNLSIRWRKVLDFHQIEDKTLLSSIALLPASIIVCEALFKSKQEEVTLLRASNDIDYSTILQRIAGMSLFDLCVEIAKAWEMPETISQLVLASNGNPNQIEDPQILNLSKWMHLLFFYELSQPLCIEAGLNDFIEFQIDYVGEVYNDFQELILEDS
jgi:hypothetical protein